MMPIIESALFWIPPHRPSPNIAPSWNVALRTDPLPIVRYDAKGRQ